MENTLNDFLETNTLIKLIDGKWHGASANGANWLEHDATIQSFAQEDFIALDDRLAFVLPELAKVTARKGGIWNPSSTECAALVPTTLIRATLAYWNGLTFTLDPKLGLAPIRGVGRIEPGLLVNTGATIKINLHEYWLSHCTAENGEIISFVAKHHFKVYEVERSWLETCFPKWEERYRIADSLNYAESTLLHYVFPLKAIGVPQPTLTGELPDNVDFGN